MEMNENISANRFEKLHAINLQEQIEAFQTEAKRQQEIIATINEQYENLKQQLIELRRQHFGSKTKRYIPAQGLLFDISVTDVPLPEEYIEGFHRRKPKRKHPHHVIPEHLP